MESRDSLMESMTFLNEIAGRYPAAVSLASGRPFEGNFELTDVQRYLERYLRHLREDAGLDEAGVSRTIFQYGRTSGLIQDLIARHLALDEGLTAAPESLVVTVGAQEGMFITLRALCTSERDVLLVAEPCYVGILGAARLVNARVVAVPEDAEGTNPDTFLEVVARVKREGLTPKAFYLVPDFANPSGVRLSLARRRRLLEAAHASGVLLIEDNPYGMFPRTDDRRPTLKALDERAQVVYIGSFAKTCFPGARVGYVVADQLVDAGAGPRTPLADVLTGIKSMVTVNTSPLTQAVVGGMLLCNGLSLRDANQALALVYRRNLAVLLAELEAHFPAAERERHGISWSVPEGGFFLTLHVPFEADARSLEVSARQYGVLWTPMRFFYLQRGGERAIRLSYSALSEEAVRTGVSRLAAFVTAQLGALAGA